MTPVGVDRSRLRELLAAGAQLVEVLPRDEYEDAHLPGAVSLPLKELNRRSAGRLDRSRPVVVYCWGPGCNGATKAGAKISALGREVKEMIGGFEYWVREGQPTENDEGPLERTFDSQVMVVRAPARA